MIYSLFNRLLGLKGPECPKKSIYPRGWPLQTPQQKRRAVLSSGNKLASKNELLESQLNNNLRRYSLFSYGYQLLVKKIFMSSTLSTRVIPYPIKKKDFFELYPFLLFYQECQQFIGYNNVKLFSTYP